MTTRPRRTTTTRRRRSSSSTSPTSSRSSRSSTSSRRRRTPTVAAGLGTALGTFAVAWLLSASWPVRIGLVVLVLLAVTGYAIWRERSAATAPPDQPGSPGA